MIEAAAMLHCDFCNELSPAPGSIAWGDWNDIIGKHVQCVFVNSAGQELTLDLPGKWLACPFCSSLILDSRWHDLLMHAATCEGLLNDEQAVALLATSYVLAFDLPPGSFFNKTA